MSRFSLLLVVSALMLVVAACETNGDDDVDEPTDDTVEVPADDNGDPAVPEEDDGDATVPEDDDAAVDPDDEAAVAPGDDDLDAIDDEEVVLPDDAEEIDPEDFQPGEQPGMFMDISFEEADDLTDFDLREPTDVPEAVELQTIIAMASPDATEEELEEEATTVTFNYMQPPEGDLPQGLPVEFTQTSEMDMREGLPPEAEQEQVTVGDAEVTRVTVMAETGDEIIGFLWDDDGVYYSMAAVLGPDMEESDLEAMAASVAS